MILYRCKRIRKESNLPCNYVKFAERDACNGCSKYVKLKDRMWGGFYIKSKYIKSCHVCGTAVLRDNNYGKSVCLDCKSKRQSKLAHIRYIKSKKQGDRIALAS